MMMTFNTSPRYSLIQKVGLVIILILLLWFIGKEDETVLTALHLHQPSLRIFRSLLEINLALFCAAFSLYIWTKVTDEATIESLLFQRIYGVDPGHPESSYREVELNDDEILGQDDDMLDADYASDGEIDGKSDDFSNVPSAAAVLHTAVDLFILIQVALFLYTVITLEYTDLGPWKFFSRIAAPVVPLLLFVYLAFKAFFPWTKRGPFWIVVSRTLLAPTNEVTFRDGFIGDILTSSVRPLQDVATTIFYLVSGLRGYWSQQYRESFLSAADHQLPALERSWLLHTVVLPACMISPLWWRFLQNLRQIYDNRTRWPYLGNAFKYFLAAQVATYGVFHPYAQNSAGWIVSFIFATLYQVWWDIFQDWNLLPSGKLRRERLYSERTYWIVLVLNFFLRFCWTLSFLPPQYLNSAGVLTENHMLLGPFIASAEIVRRTMWGILRFEWEVLQVTQSKEKADPKSIELKPMKIQNVEPSTNRIPSVISEISDLNGIEVLGELCAYASAFCVVGSLMAAHRGTA